MTQVKPLDVVAIGEAMVEFNQQDPTHYLAGFGGDTSNCVIAAARMGAKTAYLTRLGDDVFGDDLLALWQREGVATQGVGRVAGGQTGLYFVTHGAQGHRFSYRRADSAASRMSPAMLPVDLIASARWLHCSGISQAISASACDTVLEAIARARAAGTRVSYDLNFRPSLWPAARALAIARATLAQCDLFFPSIDEVAALTGLNEPEDVIAWSHAQGASMAALKLGARGSLVSTADGIEHVAPHPVQPVDATGAGDCYAGALLARLAAGDALADAARAANVAAALSTQGYGAVAPLPRWADVQRQLSKLATRARGSTACRFWNRGAPAWYSGHRDRQGPAGVAAGQGVGRGRCARAGAAPSEPPRLSFSSGRVIDDPERKARACPCRSWAKAAHSLPLC